MRAASILENTARRSAGSKSSKISRRDSRNCLSSISDSGGGKLRPCIVLSCVGQRRSHLVRKIHDHPNSLSNAMAQISDCRSHRIAFCQRPDSFNGDRSDQLRRPIENG